MLNRLEEADLIIYLDYSGMRNVWQYIKRYITHRKKNRTELPDAKEVFYWRIFKRLFDKGKEWRVIEDVLRKVGDKEKVLRISSPRELCAYLKYC
jgi:adenylate kinase family enzyme